MIAIVGRFVVLVELDYTLGSIMKVIFSWQFGLGMLYDPNMDCISCIIDRLIGAPSIIT